MTDVSTTCALVIFRVKVSCITSLFWWYYTLVIDLIGQLRRHVIGRLSVKLWCHWLWRLVKLLLKWLLGSNLSQLYLQQLVKIALSTLLRLCKGASVYETCLSCRVRGYNGYTSTPPLPSTPQAPEVRFYVDQRFQTNWMNEKKYYNIFHSQLHWLCKLLQFNII